MRCVLDTSEEEEDDKVKCAGGDNLSLKSAFWISCFLFTVLFYEALAFDSTGTEAHPAMDSRTGQCTVTPRHMTTLT